MENSIVKIRKLDDISENDWEINLANDGKIYLNHKKFYEIVEKGMEDKKNTAPTIKDTNPAMFFPKDDKFENLRKREKKLVEDFRNDVKSLKKSEFDKKYSKIKKQDIEDLLNE
tara:strand:- start:240 stop:581 length:342 start_codon:yes stop_codon:yes gene_type:complete